VAAGGEVACEPPPKMAPATSGVAHGYPRTRGGRAAIPEAVGGPRATPKGGSDHLWGGLQLPQVLGWLAATPEAGWPHDHPRKDLGWLRATSGGGSHATPLGFSFFFFLL
jgi:hypothetical protein